ncbi:MAG: hypothetical protein DLM60_13585 [Pseudonocardiales bacterium]|nr:MAG: hypothetical protein DLM60_13585 [Pseudonocardiales bacterium]
MTARPGRPDGRTPISKKLDPQAPRQLALIAVVDTATATRYGLPTAVPGVLAPDPGATGPTTYPLTTLSYAVTAPSKLDAAAGKDYAAFLRYAAGPGQEPGIAPGQLPPGMAPLPDPLKAQTITAAATIEAQAGKTPTGPPTPTPPTPTPAPGGGGPLTTIIAELTAGLESLIHLLHLLQTILGAPQFPLGP